MAGIDVEASKTAARIVGSSVNPAPQSSSLLLRCPRHPAAAAHARCDKCQMAWCERCLKQVNERGQTFWICSCGGRAEPLPQQALQERRDYERWIGNALKAPLSGIGLKLMVVGSLCYGLLDAWLGTATRQTLSAMAQNLFGTPAAGLLPTPMYHDLMTSGVGIVLFLLVCGYQIAWFLQVVQDSSRGRPALADFPDITSAWESIGVPALKGVAASVACIGPGIVACLIGLLPWWIGGVIAFAGLLVLPMALASIALEGSLRGLDPMRIRTGIVAGGLEYAFAAGLFLAMFGAMLGGSFLFGAMPWIGPFLKAFVILASSAMAAQVLGLVIARKDAELRWLGGRRHRS